MNTSQYSKLRAAGRILAALFIGVVVFILMGAAVSSAGFLPQTINSQPWSQPFLNHTAMWIGSLILIMIMSKGHLRAWGFCLGGNYKTASMIILATAIGFAHDGVLALIPNGAAAFQLNFTFAQTVIFVWLYASICEEIFTRGLIQGFLTPLTVFGISFFGMRISLPAIVSGLFFGLMHLAILTTGAPLLPVLCTVMFASVMGIVAGYHREQTGSLIPAIIVHMFTNIGGYAMNMLLGR